MTLALVTFKAWGVEHDEPLMKRFVQRVKFHITGANTDATYDFGNYTGTFWTAVGSTEPGATALKAIKDIQTKAVTFIGAYGLGLAGRSAIGSAVGNIVALTSAAGSGGAATEALTVTGLATTDTILAVSQQAKGTNGTAINLWTDTSRTANLLTVGWTADPGSGAKVRVLVQKAAIAPVAGQYELAMDGTNGNIPDISFASGDAPTLAQIVLEWELSDQQIPDYVNVP